MLEMLSSFILTFLASFRKRAFTRINSPSEIESISCLVPAFHSSNVWGITIFIYGVLEI